MNKLKVKYIGFYGSNLTVNENRNSFLAATNKMDYITNTIAKLGVEIEIISPSWTQNSKGVYSGKKIKMSNNIVYTCGPTFGAKSKITKYLRILFSWIWLIFYVIKNTTSQDVILVYHSLMLIVPVKLIRKFKKNILILEIEEIYQDVSKLSRFAQKQEYSFFDIADKYIFPTELLNQKLNAKNKSYVLISGTYQVEEIRNNKFNDGKIHAVYAGTFDPRKGGALAAAAEYLPKNYHVHIIGFGSNDDKRVLLNSIDNISKNTEATVTYDGLLRGDEYINFLQKCDIGLSTQLPDAEYNETSFPSKILSYMANGLRVVSIRIKAIETSEVGHAVYYFDDPSPESIANAIVKVDLNENYESRDLIRMLDENFINNIEILLGIRNE